MCCFICAHRRVAVPRYRMICLVLIRNSWTDSDDTLHREADSPTKFVFSFTLRHPSWPLIGLNISEFTFCIPLNLRSKTRQKSTIMLLTWIYFCRSAVTVNFILPFMTNVTISLSISQIFRSWETIYQLRPPMAYSSHSLYSMPWLAPRMDVLFWERHDFQISFSNRDTSKNAWNRHWRSLMVDTGILSNNTTSRTILVPVLLFSNSAHVWRSVFLYKPGLYITIYISLGRY